MTRLLPGIFERRDRKGYWFRDHRNNGDRWKKVGTTIAEANRTVRKLRADAVPRSRITVAQAAERWLESDVATRRCERARKDAARTVRLHLVPAFGMRPLSLVTAEHLRAYRLTVERKKLAPVTVSHILSDVRALLLWAVEAGLLDRSPVPRRLLPRVPLAPPKGLTVDELEGLAGLTGAHGFTVRFLLATGLRWGEATRALASDVERGHLVVRLSKSGRFRRVPLSPALLDEIRGHVGRLVPFASSCSFNKTIRRQSGVTAFHAHRCRHTFAMRWLASGASLANLQVVLGHADLATTMRYARVDEGTTLDQARRMWESTA